MMSIVEFIKQNQRSRQERRREREARRHDATMCFGCVPMCSGGEDLEHTAFRPSLKHTEHGVPCVPHPWQEGCQGGVGPGCVWVPGGGPLARHGTGAAGRQQAVRLRPELPRAGRRQTGPAPRSSRMNTASHGPRRTSAKAECARCRAHMVAPCLGAALVGRGPSCCEGMSCAWQRTMLP